MGIHSVLEDVMAAAVSEKAKGEALERLIKVYLSQDQAWTGRFDAGWLWDEWPGRDGKPDTGIDLVARERDTGNLWAIQSKFYAPSTLSKSPTAMPVISTSSTPSSVRVSTISPPSTALTTSGGQDFTMPTSQRWSWPRGGTASSARQSMS